MANQVSTNANGSLAMSEILRLTILGNEAVEKKSIHVFDGVQDKTSIGRMTTEARIIQDRQATPSQELGAPDYDEVLITPQDMMVYYKFNPRTFESVWREFQPKGPLVDRVLNPNIQRALLEVTNDPVQNQIGDLIWNGDSTLGPANDLRFFSGFLTRAAASALTIDVANIGVITAANVIAILGDCVQAVPDAIYSKSELTINISTGTYRLYEEALRDLDFKGSDIKDAGPDRFAGILIKHYSEFAVNKVLICKTSPAASTTNLYGAVDMANDSTNFQIERWRPESELWFVKLLFKMDVNMGFFQEAVLYEGS